MSVIRNDREGIALITTMLVLLAVAAVAGAAGMLSLNTQLIAESEDRYSLLAEVAEAGVELGRAQLNGNDVVPNTGFATLESDVEVQDADGNTIPGVTRSLYAGPRGISTGQYGVFASVVSVTEGPRGERVVRRGDLLQESFAKFAYFTTIEPSSIAFGGGDELFGPVHSNDRIRIYSSGATFHGEVTTAEDFSGAEHAEFRQGRREGVPAIPMPTTAELDDLQDLADDGGMAFSGSTSGGTGQARLRLEFVALDVNRDGDTTDENEGFLMAYASSDAWWVVADPPPSCSGWWCGGSSGGFEDSPNCGHFHGSTFVSAEDHPSGGHGSDDALDSSHTRCFLGGSPQLYGGSFDPDLGSFNPSDSRGGWVEYPGTVHSTLQTRFGAVADYLFPLSRTFNPEFKGVIHVTGKAAISGTLRGRVTLAVTNDIIIPDDLVYATNPAAPGREATCDDILGLFSGDDVILSDNPVHTPQERGSGWSSSYISYDDTRDEFVHGVVLALDEFTVENYDSSADEGQPCEGNTWGRGCLYLTGGIIQRQRGAVGTSGRTGYIKRYSYDRCAATMPPPYFPTTGRYYRDQVYNVDPVDFDVAEYFAEIAPS